MTRELFDKAEALDHEIAHCIYELNQLDALRRNTGFPVVIYQHQDKRAFASLEKDDKELIAAHLEKKIRARLEKAKAEFTAL